MIWNSLLLTGFFITEILLFLSKLVVITYFIDAWLYWLHRAFHSTKFPTWFRKWHMGHHVNFQRSELFTLHPMEFLVNASAPFLLICYLIGPWFFPIATVWGLFEAARGHGHFRWFKVIPKSYYVFFRFCGIGYHRVHHMPGGEKVNLGQMLRVWDDLCNTAKVSGASSKVHRR